MEAKLTGPERTAVVAFAALSAAAGLALLGDLKLLPASPNELLLTDIFGLVRGLLIG